MTSVAFHFNAPGKLAYACRLLRKAAASGSTVAVLGDHALLAKLDEQLWSSNALDFLPHARVNGLTDWQRERTPIWLCDAADQGVGRQVLLNLTQAMPGDVDRFDRVIEVVSQDEADRLSARLRWKQYTAHGYEIERHEINLAT